MIVLGIDPGSASTGYGLVECRRRRHLYLDCGCIRPPAKLSFADRLVFIYEHMGAVLESRRPDEVAIESIFYGKDADAASKLGHARGVLLLVVRQAALPIEHYPPAQVKKAVVGRGRASKEQVQFMVGKLLGLREVPRPLDASDALAIALCHLYQRQRRPQQAPQRRKPEIEALLRRVKSS